MMRPGFSWAIYFHFRAVGVVFVAWALAAQFLILADDLKAYNLSRERVETVHDIGTRLSLINDRPAPTMTPAGTLSTAAGSWAPVVDAMGSSSSAYEYPAVSYLLSSDDEERGRTKTAIDPVMTGLITTGEGVLRREARNKRQSTTNVSAEHTGERQEQMGTEYHDGSGIPPHAGGVVFAVLSRLLYATVLGVLLCAQAGIPEKMLYDHLGWLGPASTPAPLGFCQILIATTTLSAHARDINLIPAWALLGIGCINLLLGACLRFAYRKFPRSPPPMLYFHRNHRVLYRTVPPEFYDQLTRTPLPRHSEVEEREVDLSYLKELEAQDVALSQDASVTPQNARERSRHGGPIRPAIGNDHLQDQAPQGTEEYGRALDAHQDVLKGGYPTFTGGGMTDVERQIPVGVLERGVDGEVERFTPERDTTPPESSMDALDSSAQGTRDTSVLREKRRGEAGQSEDKRKLKKSRRGKKHNRQEDSRRQMRREEDGALAHHPPHGVSSQEIASNITIGHAPVSLNCSTQGARPPHEISSHARSDPVQVLLASRSTEDAARELGPRFPPPPPRTQQVSHNEVKNDDEAYGGLEEISSVSINRVIPGVTGEAIPTDNAAATPPSPLTPHLHAIPTKAKLIKLGMAQGRTITPEPPLPALPSSAIPLNATLHPSKLLANGPEAANARRASLPSLAPTSDSSELTAPVIRRASSLRLSSASVPRVRTNQGVRFNLSNIQEISPLSTPASTPRPTPTDSATFPPPSAGLRIPGLGFMFALSAFLGTQNPSGRVMITHKDQSEEERPQLVSRKSSGELDPSQNRRPRSMMLPSEAVSDLRRSERERRRSSVGL